MTQPYYDSLVRASLLALSCLLLSCEHSQAVAPATKTSGNCEKAAQQRARVNELFASGRVHRSLAVLDRAEQLCPNNDIEEQLKKLRVLVDLSKHRRASQLIATIREKEITEEQANVLETLEKQLADRAPTFAEGKPEKNSPRWGQWESTTTTMQNYFRQAREKNEINDYQGAKDLYLLAWQTRHPLGQALKEAGDMAKKMGDKIEAQKLYDRAIEELEDETQQPISLAVPNGFTGAPKVFWLNDPKKLLIQDRYNVSVYSAITLREEKQVLTSKRAIVASNMSRDNSTFVYADEANAIHIVELASANEIATFEVGATIKSVALSPVGDLVAASQTTGQTTLWQTKTKAIIQAPKSTQDKTPSSDLVFAPDGSFVAWGTIDSTLLIMDTSGQTDELQGCRLPIVSLDIDQDSKNIVSVSLDKMVRLWDKKTKKIIGQPKVWPKKIDHVNYINKQNLVFGSQSGFDIVSSQTLNTISSVPTQQDDLHSMALSPDGQSILLSSENGSIFMQPIIKEGPIRSVERHSLSLSSAHVGPRAEHIVMVGQDGSIRILDTKRPTPARLLPFTPTGLIELSPGEDLLALGTKDTSAIVIDLVTGNTKLSLSSQQRDIRKVAFSPDEVFVATGTTQGKVGLWNIESKDWLYELPTSVGGITSLVFSSDGRTLAVGGASGMIELWDVETGSHLMRNENVRSPVKQMVFSKNTELLFALFDDGSVISWRPKDGKKQDLGNASSRSDWLLLTEDANKVIVPSPEYDAKIIEFNQQAQKIVRTSLLQSHQGTIETATLLGNDYLLTGGKDRAAKFWDIRTAKLVTTLKGHLGPVNKVGFIRNEDTMITVGLDGIVKIWSVPSGELLGTSVVHKDTGMGYVVTPSGYIQLLKNSIPAGERLKELPVCRLGPKSFPFELCEERFTVPSGLLYAIVRGDKSYEFP